MTVYICLRSSSSLTSSHCQSDGASALHRLDWIDISKSFFSHFVSSSLAQHADGSWDPDSPGLAIALLAHFTRPKAAKEGQNAAQEGGFHDLVVAVEGDLDIGREEARSPDPMLTRAALSLEP